MPEHPVTPEALPLMLICLHDSAGTANNMKTGELTHTGTAVAHNEHFEPTKIDNFEGLGLPTSLADHLEGTISTFLCLSVMLPLLMSRQFLELTRQKGGE
jgi:hypothetical protein